jgi:hypothetical protein
VRFRNLTVGFLIADSQSIAGMEPGVTAAGVRQLNRLRPTSRAAGALERNVAEYVFVHRAKGQIGHLTTFTSTGMIQSYPVRDSYSAERAQDHLGSRNFTCSCV